MLALLLSLASIVPQARSKDGDVLAEGELPRALAAAVEAARGEGLRGAVLVAREGRVLLARGYGMRDLDDEPCTPLSLFELASASKQITAAAILCLEQDGKLATGDTLDAFFDDVPEHARGIQIHHLLTHTSGLSPELGVPYASPIARADYVRQMLAEPLKAPPGTKHEYNNAGYALLAAVIEEVSGESLQDYCEARLFKPAKMKGTGFIGDRDLKRSKHDVVRRTAEPGSWTAASWHFGFGYKGMGGVVTTVHDLFLWDRALRSDAVLKQPARAKLFTPFLDGYAYGWRMSTTDRGTRKAEHGGSVAGFGAQVALYLEDDACVFVLTDDPRAAMVVAGALERALFPPLPIEAEVDLRPYELDASRILALPAGCAWRVAGSRKELVLELVDGDHVALSVRAPASVAAKLEGDFEAALAGRTPEEEAAPAAVEATLYVQAFAGRGDRFDLGPGLRLDVLSQYRGVGSDGEPVTDPRAFVRLSNDRSWPLIARMTPAAARALLEALRAR